MDINALKAFVEVARQHSFSDAADALHLTQPAVSKRVAQLESELGTRLFDRIGRGVSPTAIGAALLPRAQRMLRDVVEFKRVVAELAGDVSGQLTMATSHHIGLHRLPDPLRRFTESYPAVELDIRFMDSEAACRAVESGELELAIVTLPPQSRPNLALESIWHDPLVFMVGQGHPLAERDAITLRELLDYPAVLPGDTTYTRGILEQAVQGSAPLHVAMATNYLETLHMLVAAGLGWSLLPATQLDERVHALRVDGLDLARELGAVTHRRRSLSNAAQAMVSACRDDA